VKELVGPLFEFLFSPDNGPYTFGIAVIICLLIIAAAALLEDWRRPR
jgi:hypothetical protein